MKVTCSGNIEQLSIVPAKANADDPTVISKLEEPTTAKAPSSSPANSDDDVNKVPSFEKNFRFRFTYKVVNILVTISDLNDITKFGRFIKKPCRTRRRFRTSKFKLIM